MPFVMFFYNIFFEIIPLKIAFRVNSLIFNHRHGRYLCYNSYTLFFIRSYYGD